MKGVNYIPRSTLAQVSRHHLDYYGLTVEHLTGPKRDAVLTEIRRDVWIQLHEQGWNYSEIARAFHRRPKDVRKTILKFRAK